MNFNMYYSVYVVSRVLRMLYIFSRCREQISETFRIKTVISWQDVTNY